MKLFWFLVDIVFYLGLGIAIPTLLILLTTGGGQTITIPYSVLAVIVVGVICAIIYVKWPSDLY
jgi:hypothetical protein